WHSYGGPLILKKREQKERPTGSDYNGLQVVCTEFPDLKVYAQIGQVGQYRGSRVYAVSPEWGDASQPLRWPVGKKAWPTALRMKLEGAYSMAYDIEYGVTMNDGNHTQAKNGEWAGFNHDSERSWAVVWVAIRSKE
ncbi:MAG: hypothetical protein KF693_07950, partial [Nitrospira sp.]|nr:hypothetical protein [Nitrospira sp.]